MTESRSESDIHSRIYTRIKDYISNEDTNFENIYTEYSTDAGRADIYVENPTEESLIIEAKAPDKYLLKRDHIKQARDYAESLDFSTFALVNENDLFLFDYNEELEVGDIEFYHLNLREFDSLSDAVPKILKAVKDLHHKNELPHQKEKDRIIALLRSFHSSITKNYISLAKEKYGKDLKFKKEVENWVKENDYNNYNKDKQIEILSKQFTYSLAIKILFYKILRENNIGKKHNARLDELGSDVGVNAMRTHIKQQFEYVNDKINYEPIFNEKGTVFEHFPRNRKGQEAIKQLLENFRNLDITDVNEDLLGQLYEDLIPKEERERLGQYYTPQPVAESIVRWTLRDNYKNNTPKILDPACGSGTFPVEVYKYMNSNYNISHQQIIDSISMVDINKFPLHLTGLNLAGRNISEKTNHIDTNNMSFFDYPEPDEIEKFDAVVGNPPYIDSDSLYPDQEHFRKHLKEYNPEGNKNPAYYNGTKRFSKKSDAYIYFITNSLRYLKDGGRLGFIVPKKWMETKYGEPFQQFLFDNVKLESVVTFGSRVFDDALVKSCLLLIEKEKDNSNRMNTVCDFIHVKNKMEPKDLVNSINCNIKIPDGEEYVFESMDGMDSLSIKQEYLESRKGKLTYLLEAPKQLIDIIESDSFCTLKDCAETSRGKITGANKFFFLDEDELEEWNIDDKFVKPAIKSIRDIESLYVRETDVDRYLLDVNWFIQENDCSDSDGAKKLLKDKGYNNLVNYINYGEDNGWNKNSKPKTRDVWFNLGELTQPDLLHPKFYNERIFTIVNRDNLAPSDAIDCVQFSKNKKAMAAVMNSTVYRILLEFWGRSEGGGALQVMTYELESIPVPDPNNLTDREVAKLESSYQNIIDGEYDGIADEVILEKFNIDLTQDELDIIHKNLVKSRIGSSEDTTTLIRNTDDIDEDMSVFDKR